jgi:hypothetical protein
VNSNLNKIERELPGQDVCFVVGAETGAKRAFYCSAVAQLRIRRNLLVMEQQPELKARIADRQLKSCRLADSERFEGLRGVGAFEVMVSGACQKVCVWVKN